MNILPIIGFTIVGTGIVVGVAATIIIAGEGIVKGLQKLEALDERRRQEARERQQEPVKERRKDTAASLQACLNVYEAEQAARKQAADTARFRRLVECVEGREVA